LLAFCEAGVMVRSPFWNFLVWGASDDMMATVMLVLVPDGVAQYTAVMAVLSYQEVEVLWVSKVVCWAMSSTA
jgi:hypothetical protein